MCSRAEDSGGGERVARSIGARLDGSAVAVDDTGMGSHTRPRDSAFAVVVHKNGRVLVVCTRRGKWQLPGGRLRRRERHWDAARREALEETGLRVDIRGLTGVYGRSDGSRAVVFAARASGRTRPCGPRNEIREQRWVTLAQAARLLRKSAGRRLLDAVASPRAFAAKRAGAARWTVALRRSG